MININHTDITSIQQEHTSMLNCINIIGKQRRRGQRSSIHWWYYLISADCGANLNKSWRSA
jgi:hypothetical protein